MDLAEELTGIIEESREGYEGYLRAAQNYYGMYPDEPLVKLKPESEFIAERIVEFLEKYNSPKN